MKNETSCPYLSYFTAYLSVYLFVCLFVYVSVSVYADGSVRHCIYFMNSQLATMILEMHCSAWVWMAGSLLPIMPSAMSLPERNDEGDDGKLM